MKKRVVITGMGAVTPCGNNVADSWANVLAGKSGIDTISHFDTTDLAVTICGAIKDFNYEHVIDKKDARKMDEFIQYGLVAAHEAVKDSGIEFNEENSERAGVFVGSGIGGLPGITDGFRTLIEKGPRRVSPFYVPSSIINMVAGHISMHFGIKGPNLSIVTACASGTHSIGQAMRMIQYGECDVMIAGGAEKASSIMGVAGFAAARALSTRNDEPTKASRPWDKDRDGFVLADGAGVFVLESLEHAQRRGAKIYAELIGFGMSSDAYHITTPPEDGDGAKRCMAATLKDAGINPEQVDYINAHGTSTGAGDKAEFYATKGLFGDRKDLAVSSTKSMTGHALGAAGAIEAVFTALAVQNGQLPPTINLDNPDEGFDLDFVPHTARDKTVNIALSNSFGFGGTNGTLCFAKFND